MSAVLLRDLDAPENRPISRLRSLFSQRTGIWSAVERVRLLHPGATLLFSHPDQQYERLVARAEQMTPAAADGSEAESPTLTVSSADEGVLGMLKQAGNRIANDLELLRCLPLFQKFSSGADATLQQTLEAAGVQVVGPAEQLLVHAEAEILPGVVCDLREGPVVIDAGAGISSFSFLEGPLYIGRGAHVDNARVTGGSVIGHGCRVGGEIENSLFNDWSNKHHEGFVGHSIVGSWVNLGALTTTSDLKNNYGEVRLRVPTDDLPTDQAVLHTVATGQIKFGSIIGDCVKTAIGTMLSTGTVLDAGSFVFGGNPAAYSAPFRWGAGTGRDIANYEADRFRADCRKIFARRKQKPSPEFEALVTRLHPGRP